MYDDDLREKKKLLEMKKVNAQLAVFSVFYNILVIVKYCMLLWGILCIIHYFIDHCVDSEEIGVGVLMLLGFVLIHALTKNRENNKNDS